MSGLRISQDSSTSPTDKERRNSMSELGFVGTLAVPGREGSPESTISDGIPPPYRHVQEKSELL
jgi:hypothetical protein